jgi:hypothetical protein
MAQKARSANAKTPAKRAPEKARSAAGARSAMKTSEPSRARMVVKRIPKPNKSAPVAPKSIESSPPESEKRGRGRPKGTPDVWTPEHIEEVAQQLWDYIEATDCPTEAEFCYKFGIHFQRLCEIPELRFLKDFIFAKRQAYTISRGIALTKEQGPLGAFLAKLAANSGYFSLVEKSELTGKDGAPIPVNMIKRVVVDNGTEPSA